MANLLTGTTVGGSAVWHDGNNTASKAVNGYQKFASGVIMQWGKHSGNNIVVYNVYYPIVFPTAVLSIAHSKVGLAQDYHNTAGGYFNSTTGGFNQQYWRYDMYTHVNPGTVYYIVIGY